MISNAFEFTEYEGNWECSVGANNQSHFKIYKSMVFHSERLTKHTVRNHTIAAAVVLANANGVKEGERERTKVHR